MSTVGRVHPHVQVKLIDPEGRAVETGEKGELCTRGYNVMQGYWDDEERTRECIDGAGWMRTGDLAVFDEAGYCNIVGRVKGHGDPRRREHLPPRGGGIPLRP